MTNNGGGQPSDDEACTSAEEVRSLADTDVRDPVTTRPGSRRSPIPRSCIMRPFCQAMTPRHRPPGSTSGEHNRGLMPWHSPLPRWCHGRLVPSR